MFWPISLHTAILYPVLYSGEDLQTPSGFLCPPISLALDPPMGEGVKPSALTLLWSCNNWTLPSTYMAIDKMMYKRKCLSQN